MRFDYSNHLGLPPRPYLEVRLSGPSGVIRVDMLLDTGADFNMVPLLMFRQLGVLPIKQVPLFGVGGAVAGVLGEVDFSCPAGNWRGLVIGAELAPVFPALLGHDDFFQTFDASFSSRGQYFTVEPHP